MPTAHGQTSSLRTSATFPSHAMYGPPPTQGQQPQQPNTISFSHYQPQERAFTTDPHRAQQALQHQAQQTNPYMRANGWSATDTMKYQVRSFLLSPYPFSRNILNVTVCSLRPTDRHSPPGVKPTPTAQVQPPCQYTTRRQHLKATPAARRCRPQSRYGLP